MAANGLRLNRFYVSAPVCSSTRASVLTGRTNDRTGVREQGYALRRQELTLAQALRRAGYATGHFGKWHLDGMRGPGVPVLASDRHNPEVFGFEEWLSTTNFFDLNPLLSRRGKIEEFAGDSSEIVVGEALKFIDHQQAVGRPFLAVVWYGSPHAPFVARPKDRAAYATLDAKSAAHYGELTALDRSVGTLRRRLRELGAAENTLIIFCSDNGGLPGITPETTGGLRGHKQTLYEGGIRVPAIIEWPRAIRPGRQTEYPASVMDIFPTLVDLLNLPAASLLVPVDGISLRPLFSKDLEIREAPIGFRFRGRLAWIENRYKLLMNEQGAGSIELYDLVADLAETTNLADSRPDRTAHMKTRLMAWAATVEASASGYDYPSRRLEEPDPEPVHWTSAPVYKSFLEAWGRRPEYQDIIRSRSSIRAKHGGGN